MLIEQIILLMAIVILAFSVWIITFYLKGFKKNKLQNKGRSHLVQTSKFLEIRSYGNGKTYSCFDRLNLNDNTVGSIFNLLQNLKDNLNQNPKYFDRIFDCLQKGTNYSLTLEQRAIAKFS